jgi:hypothetical protein
MGVVETVPEAGEQQPNVSLANADKSVVGCTLLSQRRQKISVEERDQKRSQQAFGGVSRVATEVAAARKAVAS